MNKNTTDITLSAYFNDIVIGYYEDEDLVNSLEDSLDSTWIWTPLWRYRSSIRLI